MSQPSGFPVLCTYTEKDQMIRSSGFLHTLCAAVLLSLLVVLCCSQQLFICYTYFKYSTPFLLLPLPPSLWSSCFPPWALSAHSCLYLPPFPFWSLSHLLAPQGPLPLLPFCISIQFSEKERKGRRGKGVLYRGILFCLLLSLLLHGQIGKKTLDTTTPLTRAVPPLPLALLFPWTGLTHVVIVPTLDQLKK